MPLKHSQTAHHGQSNHPFTALTENTKANGIRTDTNNVNNSNPSNDKKEPLQKPKSEPKKVETISSEPTPSSSKMPSKPRSVKEKGSDKEGGSVEPVASSVQQAQDKFNTQLRYHTPLVG
jgi:hypothetical protein